MFKSLQEAVRKDVERAFGVQKKHLHVALHPRRYPSVKQLIKRYKAASIFHSRCVEDRRDNVRICRRRSGGEEVGQVGGGAGADSGGVGSEHGSGSNTSGGVDVSENGGNGENGLGDGCEQSGGAHKCGIDATGSSAAESGRFSAATALSAIYTAPNPPPTLEHVSQSPSGSMDVIFRQRRRTGGSGRWCVAAGWLVVCSLCGLPLRLVSAFGARSQVCSSANHGLTAGRVNPDWGVSCIGGTYLHRRHLAARDRAS